MNAERRTPKILIVDDEGINLRLMGAVLKNYDYIYDTARNGIEAIEKTKEMSPDLIFFQLADEFNEIFETHQD